MSVHVKVTPAGRKRYVVRWRQGDKQRSRAFDRKGDADRFDLEVRRIRQAGELDILERGQTTLGAYATEWFDRYARRRLSPGTLDTYALQLDKRIIPKFGGWALRDITPAAVEEWIGELHDQRVGDPSILKALSVLQGIFKRAVIDEYVPRNPVALVDKPAQRRTRQPVLVSPMQVELMRAWLLAQHRPGDAALVALLAYSGARPESEGITMTWGQVRDRTLLIRSTKSRGRTVKERTVVLLGSLRDDLRAWRTASGRIAGLMFPRPDDGSEWASYDWDNWRERVFDKAAAAAGLAQGVRPRDLRGSFASLLIHEGRTIVDVAAQLGHSPAICLRDYAQVFEEFDPSLRVDADEVIAEARDRAARVFPLSSPESGRRAG